MQKRKATRQMWAFLDNLNADDLRLILMYSDPDQFNEGSFENRLGCALVGECLAWDRAKSRLDTDFEASEAMNEYLRTLTLDDLKRMNRDAQLAKQEGPGGDWRFDMSLFVTIFDEREMYNAYRAMVDAELPPEPSLTDRMTLAHDLPIPQGPPE